MAVSDRRRGQSAFTALELVNELGTRAVAHLNRAHFLLSDLEPSRSQHSPPPRIPSDRWYRLYAQLEQTQPEPCAVYLLCAAALVDEVHVLAERSEKLARHSRRAPVREQVAQHLDAVTPWTTQLLNHACALSQPDPSDDDQALRTTSLVSGQTKVFLSHTSPPTEDDDARQRIDSLAAQAVAGDARARDELLALIHPLVLKYCRARLGREESLMGSADDVAQEVCMAVVNALPHHQLKGLSFRAFVYGIAAHKVTDAFRAIGRTRAEPVADLPDGPAMADGPEPRMLAAEMSAQLGTLLGHLTPRQREVIVLRLAVGLSIDEVSEAVRSTPGGVRVTQHRALTRLRQLFDVDESVDEFMTRMRDDPITIARAQPDDAGAPAGRSREDPERGAARTSVTGRSTETAPPGVKPVRIFLSWCHNDRRLVESLLNRLRPALSILRDVGVEWWEDSHLTCGEDLLPSVMNRLDEADYGLLLLSGRYFGSSFIRDHELPRFAGAKADRRALPVLLSPLPGFGSGWNLRGVEQQLVFTRDGRSYTEQGGEADRTRFANELAASIRRRILGDGYRGLTAEALDLLAEGPTSAPWSAGPDTAGLVVRRGRLRAWEHARRRRDDLV